MTAPVRRAWDDIRPSGTVEVGCAGCGWAFWVDPLDRRLPAGPFVCPGCESPGKSYPKAQETSA